MSLVCLFLSLLIHSQEADVVLPKTETKTTVQDIQLNKIEVTDKNDEFFLGTISPHRISKDKVQLYNYTDVTRVLKQSAGVYARDEDGQGLRPNIGLRGTNPDRSKKIVFLEDDILIGPAPYSAPAAYYTPSMNHVESVDIYKGFTAVPYGPNSIGGSINYVTTTIGTDKIAAQASAGVFNTQNYKLSTTKTLGNTQWLVEASRNSSDGFKQIDGGGDAGFEKNEILIKGRWKLKNNGGNEHYIETRFGYSDELSNETYLGLSVNDLNNNPFRRYSSSAIDNMEWQHSKAQLEHVVDFNSSARLKTTIYRHDFERLWFRLDRFADSSAASVFDVLANPSQNSYLFGVLSGTENSTDSFGNTGNLFFLGNQRTFYSQGVQSKFNTQYDLGNTKHDLEFGLRFHQDQIRRTHMGYEYQMLGGRLNPFSQGTAQALNRNQSNALTAHLVETMSIGRWVFTALGRAESVDFKFQDTLNPTSIDRSDIIVAPGAAVLYKLTNNLSLKTSVNRGITVAGLSDRGTERPEESINYEMGLKYISDNSKAQAEVIAFRNDYTNITGTCTGSTGCNPNQLDQQFNGGRALIEGVETRVAYNVYVGAYQIPLQVNLTAMNAEFKNSFESPTAEWGVGVVRIGDPLPYIPQLQYTASVGLNYKKLSQDISFIYQSESYDQSVREARLTVPAYGMIDWTARYELNKQTRFFARVDNLLGREYIVSYKPFGARPGKPQSFIAGVSYTF